MQLTLYKMTCDKNVVDKTDYITEKLDILGNLRENTNVVNPSITVKFSNTRNDTPSNYTVPINAMVQYNYCYIPEFGRYYFIDDIEWIGSGMHNLYLTVDVLYTFRASILNLECGITRNEFKYTPYLPDDMMPVMPIAPIEEYIITPKLYNDNYSITPNNDAVKLSDSTTQYDHSDDIHQFLLITASARDSKTIDGQSPTYIRAGGYVSPSILRSAISSNSYSAYFIGTNCYNAISHQASIDTEFAEKIVAIYFFPISIKQIKSSLTATNTIRVGKKEWSFMNMLNIPITDPSQMLVYKIELESVLSWSFKLNINDLTLYNGDERLKWISSNNTKYNLYIPFFGIIDFNPFDFMKNQSTMPELFLYISLEPFSGTISYIITFDSAILHNVAYSGTSQLNQMPITYTNFQEIERNKFLSVMNLGINTLSSVITRGTNIASTKLLSNRYKKGSKNFKKSKIAINKEVAGGASDLISSVGDVVGAFTEIEHTKISYTPSDYIYTLTKFPYVMLIKHTIYPCITAVDKLDKYAHIYGLPYCAIETLSNLHGYTVCADFHLDNIYLEYPLTISGSSTDKIRPVSDELDMIEEYLKTGIILPDKEVEEE